MDKFVLCYDSGQRSTSCLDHALSGNEMRGEKSREETDRSIGTFACLMASCVSFIGMFVQHKFKLVVSKGELSQMSPK